MSPIFKGPLFPHRKAKSPTDTFTESPVAHGNIDEQDFSAMKSGRPTRAKLIAAGRGSKANMAAGIPVKDEEDLEMQIKRKEQDKDE